MLFRDVLVDENLKQQLISLVKNNRISHAQLFLGPAGSHKFALAIAYAQYILCANRGEEDSCGTCPSCVKFAKLAHPDLHLIFLMQIPTPRKAKRNCPTTSNGKIYKFCYRKRLSS